eukprot:354411-Chlamydomonas_euryale.AAC.14
MQTVRARLRSRTAATFGRWSATCAPRSLQHSVRASFSRWVLHVAGSSKLVGQTTVCWVGRQHAGWADNSMLGGQTTTCWVGGQQYAGWAGNNMLGGQTTVCWVGRQHAGFCMWQATKYAASMLCMDTCRACRIIVR